MWTETVMGTEYQFNSAQEAREYFAECRRRVINKKIKEACEAGMRNVTVKLLPENMQKELEDKGYEIINGIETTSIKW